jgi:hypothetical protein
VTLVILAGLAGIVRGEAGADCGVIASCEFESPRFAIRVVDDETGQPVADAHAMAVWLAYGTFHGRSPIMALEAISAPDGTLTFPAWGPRRGPDSGLEPGRDPVISIYQPGYRALLLLNSTPPGQPDTARVRPFLRADSTFRLVAFRGTATETVAELRRAAFPIVATGPSKYHPESIRRVYLNRWQRVRAETERLPQDVREVRYLLDRLNSDISLFSKGGN